MADRLPATVPLVREQLDDLRCNCGREHDAVVINQRCHPGASCFVSYNRFTGHATAECAVCQAPVVTIAVASKSDQSQAVN